jgi:3'-phosphoadenosine 5'-phosphosulfate sulfotransferase (PAPS reductase)/FAD synthetase
MIYNPYRIEAPGIVSFSGGRTSAFMLAKVVEAYGGALPPDIVPVFCNTGLEHAATYAFVAEVSKRIAPVVWLEYRRTESGPSFAEVSETTYSRNGEPFTAMIKAHNYLPNPVTRKCTSELKIRTSNRWAKERGWTEYTNAIGLRADELRRVAKLRGDTKSENAVAPMAEAGHTLEDVLDYWSRQDFDLELPNGDNAFGNCTLCFLKSRERLLRVMRQEPELAQWWIDMENLGLSSKPEGGRFRCDRPSYAGLLEISKTQQMMFPDVEEDTISCACTD